MKMKLIFVLALGNLLFLSCEEDKNVPVETKQLVEQHIDSGSLVINELCYKSDLENEFGKKSDWFEIYNPTENDIYLTEGKWSLTDNPTKIEKYILPEVKIESGEHIVIFCDGKDTFSNEIHTNFKLSSKGESISIYYDGKLIDQHVYDSTSEDSNCKCREEDGADKWVYTNQSTPGTKNI
ncbi:lamin tail domain-containing protein [Paracrocinitomix mangrovi]|uniref:lamin tail domain-containing protein n=1 Tax=Paracrocinitomix mangrovi TaxID=2862509 RepID=UPI001C8DD5ED|nr:lamin tail domain-containing protein [Paracrocinitomix mangrovi]UKN02469.1 lamin tail domain-containing protein [Paracrocinitomix mangrovi]